MMFSFSENYFPTRANFSSTTTLKCSQRRPVIGETGGIKKKSNFSNLSLSKPPFI